MVQCFSFLLLERDLLLGYALIFPWLWNDLLSLFLVLEWWLLLLLLGVGEHVFVSEVLVVVHLQAQVGVHVVIAVELVSLFTDLATLFVVVTQVDFDFVISFDYSLHFH